MTIIEQNTLRWELFWFQGHHHMKKGETPVLVMPLNPSDFPKADGL